MTSGCRSVQFKAGSVFSSNKDCLIQSSDFFDARRVRSKTSSSGFSISPWWSTDLLAISEYRQSFSAIDITLCRALKSSSTMCIMMHFLTCPGLIRENRPLNENIIDKLSCVLWSCDMYRVNQCTNKMCLYVFKSCKSSHTECCMLSTVAGRKSCSGVNACWMSEWMFISCRGSLLSPAYYFPQAFWNNQSVNKTRIQIAASLTNITAALYSTRSDTNIKKTKLSLGFIMHVLTV